MTHPGIGLRLRRIAPSGRAVIVPMDHGVSSGPIQGLQDPAQATHQAAQGGAKLGVRPRDFVNQFREGRLLQDDAENP